jgi:hypothetical protein
VKTGRAQWQGPGGDRTQGLDTVGLVRRQDRLGGPAGAVDETAVRGPAEPAGSIWALGHCDITCDFTHLWLGHHVAVISWKSYIRMRQHWANQTIMIAASRILVSYYHDDIIEIILQYHVIRGLV